MKTLSLSLLFGILAAMAGGCTSSPATNAAPDDLDVPCTCGDAYADMQGCASPLCMDGSGNPDNPDCVCGPMSITGMED